MSTQDTTSFERNRIRKELIDELAELRGGDIQRIAKRLSQVDGRKQRLVAISEDGRVALIKMFDEGGVFDDSHSYGVFSIGPGGELSRRAQLGFGMDTETFLEVHERTIDWIAPEWRPESE